MPRCVAAALLVVRAQQQSVFNRKPRLSNDSVSSAGTGSYAATVASAVHGNGLGGLPAPVVPAGGAVGKAASVGGAGGGEGALGMVERVSLGLLGKGRQSTGAGAAAAAAEEEGGKKAAGGGGSMGAPYAVNRRSYDATNVSGPLPLDDAMLLAKVGCGERERALCVASSRRQCRCWVVAGARVARPVWVALPAGGGRRRCAASPGRVSGRRVARACTC